MNRFRKLIALVPIAILMVVAWLTIVHPLRIQRETNALEYDALQVDISKMQFRLAELRNTTQDVSFQDTLVWNTNTLPEAATSLQQEVVTLAEKAGIKLTRFGTELGQETVHGVTEIFSDLEGEATMSELAVLLKELAQATPRIAVADLTIRHSSVRPTDTEPAHWLRLSLRGFAAVSQ